MDRQLRLWLWLLLGVLKREGGVNAPTHYLTVTATSHATHYPWGGVSASISFYVTLPPDGDLLLKCILRCPATLYPVFCILYMYIHTRIA